VGYKETDEVVVQIRSHEVCASCFFFVRTSSVNHVKQKRERKKRGVCGGCVDWEELTPPGHPKCLPSPVHLGGGAVVVETV
jgi:hypothetical protein